MYKAVVKIMGKFPVLVAWSLRREWSVIPLDYGDDSLQVM
jgi:citrate synthase